MLRHREETKSRSLWGRKRAEADTKCIENLFNEVTARNSQNLGIQKQEALRAPSGDDQKSPFPGCVIVQMSTMQSKEAILKAVGENSQKQMSEQHQISCQHHKIQDNAVGIFHTPKVNTCRAGLL